MTGVSPAAVACLWNSAAPNMLPWSVMATCVMPLALTSWNSSFSRAAPSSIEYSVWTCRWANGGMAPSSFDAAADAVMNPTASSGTLRAARAVCPAARSCNENRGKAADALAADTEPPLAAHLPPPRRGHRASPVIHTLSVRGEAGAGARRASSGPPGLSAFGAEDIQGVPQVVRVRAAERDLAAGDGMREGQPHRVQPLPGQPQVRREHGVGAVEQVAAARVAQRGHVHPDLVGAAGLQADAHQAGRPERLKRVVVGDARPPAGDHREPAVAGRMPPDGRVDGAAQRVRMPLDESVVRLGHGALAECLLEHAVGALALGDHHQPGGVGVQPVHDAL